MRPVYFVDALGRQTPFHLEFITCSESLIAVLKNNFKTIGHGATKISNGEFALQDSITKVDINLTSPWETCFHPGQEVFMSIIFDTLQRSRQCPKCKESARNDCPQDEDIECARCKMVFRQYTARNLPTSILNSVKGRAGTAKDMESNQGTRDATSAEDEDLEMSLFRRVRICDHPVLCYVRALYDYEADDRTSHSFYKGDIIEVITTLESGWWDGVINGARSWFPSNYCEVIYGNIEIHYPEKNTSSGIEDLEDSIEDSEFFNLLSEAIDKDSGYGES